MSSPDPELQSLAEHADARMLHLFMCDCAERAFARAQALGDEPAEDSVAAVRAKRGWLAGTLGEAELTRPRAEAVRGLYPGHPRHLGAAALAAIWLPRSGLSLPADEAEAERITRARDALEAALFAAEAAVQAVIEAVYRPKKDVDAARAAEAEERRWQRERLQALAAARSATPLAEQAAAPILAG